MDWNWDYRVDVQGSQICSRKKKDRLRYYQSKSSPVRVRIIVCIVLACLLAPLASLGKSDSHRKDDGPILSQPLSIAWRYQTDQTTDFTPAADDQTVFIPLSSGVLMALNATDGKLN